ncbi:hypothetical protein cyc_04738 [Cyclospora cayetanensis]|uniref:Uncharacterized protein n=1 Tax=Cyclospora cayetanensis TaxID=88456 RepID=A0A1D3D620_9EIME|nr:hypothetical protein cyc_04738 [Cyclospora cayetanensis]
MCAAASPAAPVEAASATALGSAATESAELTRRFALFGAAVASAQRGLQGLFSPEGAPQPSRGAPDVVSLAGRLATPSPTANAGVGVTRLPLLPQPSGPKEEAPKECKIERTPGEPLESLAAWYRRRYGAGGGLALPVASGGKKRDYGSVFRALKRFEILCAERRQRSREAIAEDRRYVLSDVLRSFSPFQVVLVAPKSTKGASSPRRRGPSSSGGPTAGGAPPRDAQGAPPVKESEGSGTAAGTEASSAEDAARGLLRAAPTAGLVGGAKTESAEATAVEAEGRAAPDAAPLVAVPPPAAAAAGEAESTNASETGVAQEEELAQSRQQPAADTAATPSTGNTFRRKRQRRERMEPYVALEEVVRALLPYHSFYIPDPQALSPEPEGQEEKASRQRRVRALAVRARRLFLRISDPLSAAAESQGATDSNLWGNTCIFACLLRLMRERAKETRGREGGECEHE